MSMRVKVMKWTLLAFAYSTVLWLLAELAFMFLVEFVNDGIGLAIIGGFVQVVRFAARTVAFVCIPVACVLVLEFQDEFGSLPRLNLFRKTKGSVAVIADSFIIGPNGLGWKKALQEARAEVDAIEAQRLAASVNLDRQVRADKAAGLFGHGTAEVLNDGGEKIGVAPTCYGCEAGTKPRAGEDLGMWCRWNPKGFWNTGASNEL